MSQVLPPSVTTLINITTCTRHFPHTVSPAIAQTGLSKCFLCCFFNLLTFKNHFRLTATVGKSDEKQCFSDSRHPVFLLDSRPLVGIHRAAVAGVATSLFPFYILVIRLLIDCRYLQIIVYIRDSCPLLYCRFHRLGEMQNGRCPPWLYHRGLCVPEIISRLIFRFSGPHRQRPHWSFLHLPSPFRNIVQRLPYTAQAFQTDSFLGMAVTLSSLVEHSTA